MGGVHFTVNPNANFDRTAARARRSTVMRTSGRPTVRARKASMRSVSRSSNVMCVVGATLCATLMSLFVHGVPGCSLRCV